MPPYLILAIFSAILGSIQFGWNVGDLNNLSTIITDFINETTIRRSGVAVDSEFSERIYSVIASIFAISGIFGALASRKIADFFGRRRGMMLTNTASITSSVCMLISKYIHSYEILIVARVFVGFASAIFIVLVPMYLTEIAPLRLRGSLGLITQIGINSGIFLGQLITIDELLGTETHWNLALALFGLLGLLQIIFLSCCPDSPVYTFFEQDDRPATQKVLRKIRNCSEEQIESEVQALELQRTKLKSTKTISLKTLLKTKILRKFLFIGIVMQFAQQFSGMSNILIYAKYLFKDVGIADYLIQFCIIGVGATMIVFAAIAAILIEKTGRRILFLSGLIGQGICCILFTVFNQIGEEPAYKYACIVCIICHVISFSIGPASIPWIFMSETFDDSSRTLAMSFGMIMNRLVNFISIFVAIDISNGLGKNVMIPYAVINAIFFLLSYFLMPETKNKTFDQIIEDCKKSHKSNKNPKS